jgi:hypothetical protein
MSQIVVFVIRRSNQRLAGSPIGDVTVFTENRERLLAGDIAAKFLAAVLGHPRVKSLSSDEQYAPLALIPLRLATPRIGRVR